MQMQSSINLSKHMENRRMKMAKKLQSCFLPGGTGGLESYMHGSQLTLALFCPSYARSGCWKTERWSSPQTCGFHRQGGGEKKKINAQDLNAGVFLRRVDSCADGNASSCLALTRLLLVPRGFLTISLTNTLKDKAAQSR